MSADRLGNTSFSLIWRISLQTLKKFTLVIWSYDLKHVKSVIVWNVSFPIPPCFPQLQKYTSKQFYDFQSIEASVLEVFKSQKLQHFCRSYKHEAFQKVKHNHTLTKYILGKDKCKRAINTRGSLVFRWQNYHPKQSLSFHSCFSFAFSSTSYLAFHS